MDMSTPVDEYELVYSGIKAVAEHCDGALTRDKVGFNGQDTKFGRRIASVPFSEWTQDVKEEAARIALTYRQQILSYLDLDVSALQVVQDAQGRGTNHSGRNDARTYERRAKVADKIALRRVDAVDGRIGIFYDKKDPDFSALLDACRVLPGRQFDWNLKCNVVDVGPALDDFLQVWDFTVTPSALALLTAPREEKYNVYPDPEATARVIIDTPYNASMVDAIRQLPGRAWDGRNKVNHVAPGPQVLALVAAFNLTIHPDARAACDKAAAALAAGGTATDASGRSTVLQHVSRAHDPSALPEAFLSLLEGVLKS